MTGLDTEQKRTCYGTRFPVCVSPGPLEMLLAVVLLGQALSKPTKPGQGKDECVKSSIFLYSAILVLHTDLASANLHLNLCFQALFICQ